MTNPPPEETRPATHPPPRDTPRPVHPSLAPGIEASKKLLHELLGDRMISLTLLGRTIEEGLRPGELEETLVLADGDLLELAERIGRERPRFEKARVGPPLLMTPRYIQRSLDVFPIEYLYMGGLHRTVSGPDPFTDLTFDHTHVRLQCEREAKRYLLHIRQGLMRSHGDQKTLRRVVHEMLNAVIPLLNAVLFLNEIDPPTTRSAIISQSAKHQITVSGCFQQVLDDTTGTKTIDGGSLISVLRDCYSSLEQLAERLDAGS